MSMNETSTIITTEVVFYGNICRHISTEHTILFCIYTGNALLGLILNGLVLWAIWPEAKSLKGIPYFALNLLCAAIIECLVLPFGACYLLNILPVNVVVCHILGLIPKTIQRTATVFLVWMFFMRYVALKKPLHYRRLSSIQVCRSVSVIMCLLVTGISIIEQVLTDDIERTCFPHFRLSTEGAVIDLILSLVFHFIPMLLLCVLGHLIYCALKNTSSVLKVQRYRIRKILILAVSCFGVVSCPMHLVIVYQSILLFYGHSIYQVNQNVFLPYQFTFALFSFGVVIAPLFYAFSSSAANNRLRGLVKFNSHCWFHGS